MKNKKNLNFIVLISTYVPEHGAEQGAERSRYLDIGAELERSNQKNAVLRSPVRNVLKTEFNSP